MTETCCVYRRKVLVTVHAVLPESACGVSDSVLADMLRFDLDVPSGRPVLAFKFCPWCGAPYTPSSEIRLSDVNAPSPPAPEVEQTYSRCSVCERGFETNTQQSTPVCPDCE